MNYRISVLPRVGFVLGVLLLLLALATLSCRTSKVNIRKEESKNDSTDIRAESIKDRTDSSSIVHVVDTGKVVSVEDYEDVEETYYASDKVGKTVPVYKKKTSKGTRKTVEQKGKDSTHAAEVHRHLNKKAEAKVEVKQKEVVKEKEKTVSTKGRGGVLGLVFVVVVVIVLLWFFGPPRKKKG